MKFTAVEVLEAYSLKKTSCCAINRLYGLYIDYKVYIVYIVRLVYSQCFYSQVKCCYEIFPVNQQMAITEKMFN